MLPPTNEVPERWCLQLCVSVYLSFHSETGGTVVLCGHYPWCIGPHHTGTPCLNLFLDLTVQVPPDMFFTVPRPHPQSPSLCTVGKRAICILLEWLLFLIFNAKFHQKANRSTRFYKLQSLNLSRSNFNWLAVSAVRLELMIIWILGKSSRFYLLWFLVTSD